MKRFLYLALLTTAPAWGQSVDSTAVTPFPQKSNFRSGFMFELGYGFAITRFANMNAFFRDNQAEFNKKMDRFFVAGMGYRRQRFKVTLHTLLMISQNLLPPNQTGSTLVARPKDMSGLDIFLGYDIANGRNRRFFLNAGVGSFRYEYSLFRATNQPVAFQDILRYTPPGTVSSLYLTTDYWNVNLEMAQREKRKETLQLVGRVGYRRSFRPRAWQSDAYQLTNAPLDRISQFYFQLGIYLSRNKQKSPQ
ncbi:hypothetical protein [Spirosoma sp.]|uniref:hypothetical protein n=1 Tax=Spirosoma sp. TaxID=1899569 RepID=UPI003B3A7746